VYRVIVELVSAAPAPSSIPAALIRKAIRIEGDNKIYERDADSGFKIRFHFCPNCGSTTSWHWLPKRAGSNVFWEGDRNPKHLWDHGRQLRRSELFRPPTYSAWEEVMHPWLGVATATEHFAQGRPLTSCPSVDDQQSYQSLSTGPSSRVGSWANRNPTSVQQIVQKFGCWLDASYQQMIAGARPFARHIVPIERQFGARSSSCR
jgi:hypothetical protein